MISENSIMDKLKQYTNTAAGKKRMKEVVKQHCESGEPLASGQELVDISEMSNIASVFIDIVRKHLPESIKSVGNALRRGTPVKLSDGNYMISITFDRDAIHRNSLYGEMYDGIENIVALLNNGYRASNYVYGYWDGHKPTGEAIFRGSLDADYAWIRSMKEREALRFMQDAVGEFNDKYGDRFNVNANLSDEYKK